MEALNGQRKSLAGSTVLLLGVAYKKNIDDMRESPAIKIAELLLRKHADVVYHDAWVPRFEVAGRDIAAVEPTEETLRGVDAVVLVTDHTGVDYGSVAQFAPLVLDTRNAMREFGGGNVVRL
jgi:UDP-N-acetyl-D-glucosamine dehydrogenase